MTAALSKVRVLTPLSQRIEWGTMTCPKANHTMSLVGLHISGRKYESELTQRYCILLCLQVGKKTVDLGVKNLRRVSGGP